MRVRCRQLYRSPAAGAGPVSASLRMTIHSLRVTSDNSYSHLKFFLFFLLFIESQVESHLMFSEYVF
jgi:hypothetical protein